MHRTPPRIFLTLPLVYVFAALVFAACSSDGAGDGGTTGEGEACTSVDECAEGLACVEGLCRTPEQVGLVCPSATLCGDPPSCCEEGSEECIGGACVPACESGVRCGSDRLTCCDSGQVCLGGDTCTDPGGPCTDSFDCEEGEFCEPTLSACLPQIDGVECTSTPQFADFGVIEEWSVSTAEELPNCVQPISSPAIADLDGDGLPEVVSNMVCNASWREGVLRVYTGTGEHVWSATDPDDMIHGRSSVAVGDINGDGLPEIIAIGGPRNGRLYAFSYTGARLWASVDSDDAPVTIYGNGDFNGGPALADLDGDGTPEIVVGAMAFDANGVLLWTRNRGANEGTNSNYDGGLSAIADIDEDGMLEVIPGRRVYEHDGTPKPFTFGDDDGYPAIANFDEDSNPEVVLVASGTVAYYDGKTGALEWGPVAIPGGGIGGPPTVADFDGDGLPEIGVAGGSSYSVYDPDGDEDLLWSMPTQDQSSNATGSSVFDFEGDGIAEVVYADECFMRAYRGSDGNVLLEIPSTSATIHEYPLVVDVDADGNSEIVIVANNGSGSHVRSCEDDYEEGVTSRNGIFVYGDANDKWVRTRRVWNQHNYHVTNVTSAGIIPAEQELNWSTPGLNNYRQNVQGEGIFNAPDLAVLSLEVELIGCPSEVNLKARVANEGTLGVAAGVPVTFRDGTPDEPGDVLGTVDTQVDLLPGASTVVELSVEIGGSPPFAFVATVDDDGTGAGSIVECNDDNNLGGASSIDCNIVILE